MNDIRINHGGRLSFDEEKELGRAIIEAEEKALEAVTGLELTDAVLSRKGSRAERTRAHAVDRLKEAVDTLAEAAREDAELRRRAKAAQSAWDRSHELRWTLAMSGRRIAYAEARKIATASLLDEEDLVTEGHIGLLRAAKRYDPDRDIRFSTYARWWVRAQMTRAVDAGGRMIRLSGCAVEQLRNLRRARKILDDANVDYTVADLATEVGISEERVRTLLAHTGVLSLEATLDDDDGPTLHDSVADDEAARPDDDVIRSQQIERLREVIHEMPDARHRHVLTRRYGLADGEHRTLAEVGKELGLSRERVRQIERQAFDWIRRNGRLGEQAGEEEVVAA